MALILNIETATSLCSVALALDGKTLSIRETNEERSHAASLSVFIEEILKERKLSVSDLDAIAVGKGPGSYTGLRIGVSVAKGLCYGSGIPLIGINTLHIMIIAAKENMQHSAEVLLCPMIDARRMEVFCCLSDSEGNELIPVSALIIDSNSFNKYLHNNEILFFGSGMEKCRGIIQHKNARFISGIQPHAAALAYLSELHFRNKQFEDVAYFEPFYLKDFVTTVPKKGHIF